MMICTAKYENVVKSGLRIVSIVNIDELTTNFIGESYPSLAPKTSFLKKWQDNIGKIPEVENNEYYIKEYWDNVLSKLNPLDVLKDLKRTVLVSFENNDEFSSRHVVAAWLELFLGLEVLEVKATEEDAKVLTRPSYIKDILESIIKESIDMKGFNSIEALQLHEIGMLYEKTAKILNQENDNHDLADEFKIISEEYKIAAENIEKDYKTKKKIR